MKSLQNMNMTYTCMWIWKKNLKRLLELKVKIILENIFDKKKVFN